MVLKCFKRDAVLGVAEFWVRAWIGTWNWDLELGLSDKGLILEYIQYSIAFCKISVGFVLRRNILRTDFARVACTLSSPTNKGPPVWIGPLNRA